LVYAAGQTVYKSEDGGSNWSTYQFEVGKPFSFIRYNPSEPNIMYLAFSEK